MSGHFVLSTVFLLILLNLPCYRSEHNIKPWLSKPSKVPTSSESIETLPYVAPKHAEKSIGIHDPVDDEEKMLSLFGNANNKRKLDAENAEMFVSVMLRALQNLFTKKPATPSPTIVSKFGVDIPQAIAWSYYDDLGK